jgi:cytochrome c-type biogenesis protein
MIEHWFSALSHAVEGTPGVALAASAVWGVLSILLSPCHLASIPLIVGFVGEQGNIPTRRAFALSLLFAAGILVTIALIGVLTAAAGRMMGDLGPYANYAVAVIFFVVGLHLLGVIPLPLPAPGQVGYKRKGLVAALALGLVFGIALGPCTFAYMAPMLAITFKVASDHTVYAALLLLAYGVGHCSVIVLAGTSTEMVEHVLRWNNQSRGTAWLKKICGALVILGGLWLLYSAP